ncbi:hypothetical protein HPB48_005253 [Haemaphysalis longicornis]|uniref:Endonuclease/exonuclease/phosphatase domain-containing protein n=1 Tax=Haemaphysalis longicornis TaxID=44386 RepID=A0A9J6FLC5_HAELO|nr:hypothetical protein HPB48_005253 [Haemaphysalis longicornis]
MKIHRLVIAGDFNALTRLWGHPSTTRKGTRIHEAAQSHNLSPWNDPLQPTRVGNSVSRDTFPTSPLPMASTRQSGPDWRRR